jgi:hypothetical protein
MRELTVITCPGCGRPVEADPWADEGQCTECETRWQVVECHCGSTHTVAAEHSSRCPLTGEHRDGQEFACCRPRAARELRQDGRTTVEGWLAGIRRFVDPAVERRFVEPLPADAPLERALEVVHCASAAWALHPDTARLLLDLARVAREQFGRRSWALDLSIVQDVGPRRARITLAVHEHLRPAGAGA